MRFIVLPALTAAALAAAAFIAPASATDTSKALSICLGRGTDCSVSNKNGGYDICVNNTGGKQCVHCPALTEHDQTCTMAMTHHRAGVGNVLAGSRKMKVMSTGQ